MTIIMYISYDLETPFSGIDDGKYLHIWPERHIKERECQYFIRIST